ncbi:hypothetical protein ACQ4PT_022521 [Festuca glaucescens]
MLAASPLWPSSTPSLAPQVAPLLVPQQISASLANIRCRRRSPPPSCGRVTTSKPHLPIAGIRAMAGMPMKSSQLQEVVAAGGDILGDVNEQVKLVGDVDKQVKVSDVVDGQVHHSSHERNEVKYSEDVDEQRRAWDAIDENKQIWDAVDEHRKLEMLEVKLKKQQERNHKKKKRMDLEVKRKELKKRRKTTRGGGSPSVMHLSQRVTRSPFVKSPLARSQGANKLRSSLGVLAEEAASKRGRPLSTVAESSPSHKSAYPSVRSPSMSRSPSSTSSPSSISCPAGGSSKITRGRKVRRLTSAVWRDFIPHYDDGKLFEAECKHCNEFLPAGRDVGTSGVRRHLTTCPISLRIDELNLKRRLLLMLLLGCT